MRLIDADALRSVLEDKMKDCDNRHYQDGLAGALLYLLSRPIIEERKHGHWIEINPKKGKGFYRCSVCNGAVGLYDDGFYCQWCGAKMDEVITHENSM